MGLNSPVILNSVAQKIPHNVQHFRSYISWSLLLLLITQAKRLHKPQSSTTACSLPAKSHQIGWLDALLELSEKKPDRLSTWITRRTTEPAMNGESPNQCQIVSTWRSHHSASQSEYISINRYTDRQIDGRTDRQTHRQSDGQTDRYICLKTNQSFTQHNSTSVCIALVK